MLGMLGMLGGVEQARAVVGAFVARSAPVRRECTPRASALEWELRIFSGVSPELNVCSVS